MGPLPTVHAYAITFSGDMPVLAMSKILCHNGHSPCHCCLITGEKLSHNYYPVLTPPRVSGCRSSARWDAKNLPLHNHDLHLQQLTGMKYANNNTQRKALAIKYGVHRLSMLLQIPSFSFPISFPYDIMHLFFENVCPLLQDHWTGSHKFKDIEPSDPGYQLAPHIWEMIGRKTAEAYRTIPSGFVGAMPDISNSKYKAKYMSFWVQFLGPLLLRNRFPKSKYYRHFCDLVQIIKTCLQFTISHTTLQHLQESIVTWVQQYEK